MRKSLKMQLKSYLLIIFMENIRKNREIDLVFDFTSFFLSGLFLIFWPTVKCFNNFNEITKHPGVKHESFFPS